MKEWFKGNWPRLRKRDEIILAPGLQSGHPKNYFDVWEKQLRYEKHHIISCREQLHRQPWVELPTGVEDAPVHERAAMLKFLESPFPPLDAEVEVQAEAPIMEDAAEVQAKAPIMENAPEVQAGAPIMEDDQEVQAEAPMVVQARKRWVEQLTSSYTPPEVQPRKKRFKVTAQRQRRKNIPKVAAQRKPAVSSSPQRPKPVICYVRKKRAAKEVHQEKEDFLECEQTGVRETTTKIDNFEVPNENVETQKEADFCKDECTEGKAEKAETEGEKRQKDEHENEEEGRDKEEQFCSGVQKRKVSGQSILDDYAKLGEQIEDEELLRPFNSLLTDNRKKRPRGAHDFYKNHGKIVPPLQYSYGPIEYKSFFVRLGEMDQWVGTDNIQVVTLSEEKGPENLQKKWTWTHIDGLEI